jgi:Carbohydrate-binding family 9
MHYTIRSSPVPPRLDLDWDDPIWSRADTLEVTQFRPESSDHRPRTLARLLHTSQGIHGLFQVHDRYVRCVHTGYFGEVWKDSCVEFFAQPKPDRGYFNLEFNCGGAFLCSYITNPERTPTGFKEFTKLPASMGNTIQVRSSLPLRIEPEITEPVVWTLAFYVPFALFEHYLRPLGAPAGRVWRGNFQKCADDCSHPHWASWAPLDELNFHRPDCFGTIHFA